MSPPRADSAPVPSWHPDPLAVFTKRWAGTFGSQTAPRVQAGFLNVGLWIALLCVTLCLGGTCVPVIQGPHPYILSGP